VGVTDVSDLLLSFFSRYKIWKSGELGRHHFNLCFSEDVSEDKKRTILEKARNSHQIVLRMPVATNQVSSHVEVEVVERYLAACEDVPENRSACL
jgi:hypothetical protein